MPSLDDLFPTSERELYARARDVLLRVACDFRFPRVLRIEAGPPADFQDAISKKFPLYERAVNLTVPDGLQLPTEVAQLMASHGNVAHVFLTEDRQTSVNLSPENMTVAINGTSYTQWEHFRRTLEGLTDALEAAYNVPFFTRIALRYQDGIHRQSLGLPLDKSWTDLIRAELLGSWPFAQFERRITGAHHRINVSLPDVRGTLALQHGLVTIPGKTGRAYMLDFDFSRSTKTEKNDAYDLLDQFHDLAGRGFRWAITPELRSALGPSTIEVEPRPRAAHL